MEAMRFADHLVNWTAEELSFLMANRPDLLSASDRGLEAVARKASTAMSLGRVLVGADVGMLVVAEALVAKHPATVAEIDALLGTGDVAAVIDVVERLRRAGVVMVDGPVISPVGSLDDLLHRPLGLGPSFVELAQHLPTATIEMLAETTNAEGGGHRSATIRAIAHRLTEPGVVTRLLESAPAESAELLSVLVTHRSPAIPLPTGYPYRGLDADDPLAWLIDTGLVIAVTESSAELPRELVMAATTDGLAPTASLRPVPLIAVEGLSTDLVSGEAAERANRLLDGVETLLRLVDEGQVSIRKAGGIGPRELKRLGKLCGLDSLSVARLLELTGVARLVKVSGSTLTTSDLAARWWTLARQARYLALVRAWMASDRFLTRGLAETMDADKIVALGDSGPIAAAAAGRSNTLQTISGLPDDSAYEPDQLAAAVVWQGPNLWGAGEPPAEVLVDWTLEESELLGLVGANAPTRTLRALLSCDEVLLGETLTDTVADDQDQFVLQSDLTAVAFGPLSPSTARSLADMTERTTDGDGRTPIFRFTEAAIRRAFDRGWDAESVTAFLSQHSLAGIPQPLEYLLADVARQYGSIRVLPAQCIVIAVDDITAVEVAANRKAANLGLRLVAPTVLTSPLDPVTVTEALRALGLFPVLEGSSIAIDGTRDSSPDSGSPSLDLPADWTGPPIPSGPLPDEVSDAVAVLLEDESGPGDEEQNRNGLERALQQFWGRSVVLDTATDSHSDQIRGTVVGLGTTVSVLTVSGIVEIPFGHVLAATEPDAR